VKLAYAGYVGWRGLAEEAAFSAATHAALGRFAFCRPMANTSWDTLCRATRRPDAGRRRYNFVWYRPAGDARC
jgi:hypothetical protein